MNVVNKDAFGNAVPTGSVPLQQKIMMPGEGAETYEELARSLYLELDPRTPYEELLVEDIATLTWDGIRFRVLRDALIVAEFRELAIGALLTGKIEKPLFPGNYAKEKKLVDGLASSDPKVVGRSLKALAVMGVKREEILARASQNVLPQIEIYSRQIASFERRRSQLLKEYRELRSVQRGM